MNNYKIAIVIIFLLIAISCICIINEDKNIDKYKCKELYDNVSNTDISKSHITVLDNSDKKRIDDVENSVNKINNRIQTLTNVVSKMYSTDMGGDYVVNGWFVQFHNIIDHPKGVILGETLNKLYGVPIICSKTREEYPFIGTTEKPIYFPKPINIGLRAMTILKINKTGYYDFRTLASDGIKLYYLSVTSDVILNEKNLRSKWNILIESWDNKAENWLTTKKLFFNQNDLVMLRLDSYEIEGYSSLCVKLRYYDTNQNNQNLPNETDLPVESIFCSLLWSEVPLIGLY